MPNLVLQLCYSGSGPQVSCRQHHTRGMLEVQNLRPLPRPPRAESLLGVGGGGASSVHWC